MTKPKDSGLKNDQLQFGGRCAALVVGMFLQLGFVGVVTGQTEGLQTYVQDSPAAAEMLATVKDRLEKKEPAEAARIAQKILKQHGRKLLATQDGRYREVRVVVEETLKGDDQLLDMYRQLYEPVATKRLNDAGRDGRLLGVIVERYGYTDAGLEAAFRLAGLLLEQDESKAAVNVLVSLAGHPSMKRYEARWAYLKAVSGYYADDLAMARENRETLVKLEQKELLQHLDELAPDILKPQVSTLMHPFERMPKAALPQKVDRALWKQGYPTIQTESDEDDASGSGDARQVGMVPIAVGPVVYASNGQTVYAVDRSSGLEIWRYETSYVPGAQRRRRGLYRNTESGGSLTFVESDGRHVIAVMGRAPMISPYTWYASSSQSSLTALDANSGERLWEVTPSSLNDLMKNAFWYGRPVAARGRVYVMLRQRSRTQFRHTYVAALNIRDGSLAWMRHVVSTEMPDRQTVPPMNQLKYEDGWLYVDSGMGAVGRLSAMDGSVDWLNVTKLGNRQNSHRQSYTSQTGVPIMTEAGLLVQDQWGDVVRLYDQNTGELKKTFTEEQFDYPYYLLGAKSGVVAVGRKVRCVRIPDAEVLWELEEGIGEPAGRGTIAGNHLYLPVSNGIVVIDTNTGKVVKNMDSLSGGNIMALDGQMVVAHPDGLASYSTWEFVIDYLNERVKLAPDDPIPHLSMAWLAYRSNKGEQLLKSVDQVVNLTRGDDSRQLFRKRLFELLMSVVQDTDLNNPGLKENVFERLGLTTNNPGEEVRYRLAMGAFKEEKKDYAGALEQYQLIVAQKEFAREQYTHNGGSRQAGLEAQRRMTEIVEAQGREVYSQFDIYASQRLDELKNAAAAEPLEDLARSYPLAKIAPLALHAAAERRAERGQIRTAVSLLHRASQMTKDVEDLGLIVGLQAKLYEKMRQPNRSRRLLLRYQTLYPNIKPVYGGEARVVSEWLAQLEAKNDFKTHLPVVRFPLNTKPVLVKGRILTSGAMEDEELWQRGQVMLKTLDHFELWDVEQPRVLWRRKMDDAAVRMLAMVGDGIWLWYPVSRRLELLNAKTGEVKYNSGDVDDVFEQIEVAGGEEADDERRLFELRRRGVVLGRRNTRRREPFFKMGLSELAVVDHEGKVVTFDASNGNVVWQGASAVSAPQHVINRGEYLVISGRGQGGEDGLAGLIVVYDVATGKEVYRQVIADNGTVQWVDVTNEGDLIYHTVDTIASVNLTTGQQVWKIDPEIDLTTYGSSISNDRLMVFTQQRDLLWINMKDGQVLNRYPLRQFNSVRFQIESIEDRWFIISQEGVLAFDQNGEFQWQDSISDPKRIYRHALADGQIMILNPINADERLPRGTRRLYTIDQDTGAIVNQMDINSSGAVDQLELFNHRVVIGTLQNIAIFKDD